MERKDGVIKTHFGVTYGEWVGLAVIVIAVIASYAVLGETVKNNSEKIKAVGETHKESRQEIIQLIKDSEGRMETHVRESEQRTRGDIRELRQIIIRQGQ